MRLTEEIGVPDRAYKLFLDDYRDPSDCATYMYRELGFNNPIYLDGNWTIVRNYDQFVNWIIVHGIPDLISFDHDLADDHYPVHPESVQGHINYAKFTEKTGYHCAQWLVEYCMDKGKKLPLYIVHSMNPVGKDNIENLLANYEKLEV
jgi:NAD+-processing family protein with receiver domain